MIIRLPNDMIRHIVSFLSIRDVDALRRTCTQLSVSTKDTGYALYDHVEDSIQMIYSNEFSFLLRDKPNPRQKGVQCRTCAGIFYSVHKWNDHIRLYPSHDVLLSRLCFSYEGQTYRVRTTEELACVEGTCVCPSTPWREYHFFRLFTDPDASYTMVMRTPMGEVRLTDVSAYGKIDIPTDRPLGHLFFKFMEVYWFRNHYWLVYFHQYDSLYPDTLLVTPISHFDFYEKE